MHHDEEALARRRGHNLRDALVFLIDWRESMTRIDKSLGSNDGGSSNGSSSSSSNQYSVLSLCLRAIIDLMRDKIRRRVSDAVSIITYGGSGIPSRASWPGIRVLRPLVSCDAAGIQKLECLVEKIEKEVQSNTDDDDNDEDEDGKFGEEDAPCHFDKALWAVRHQFTSFFTSLAQNTLIVHRKRVVILTNDDNPTRDSKAEYDHSFTQARDLYDMGISIYAYLLLSPGSVDKSTDYMQSQHMSVLNDIEQVNIPQTKTFFQPLVECYENVIPATDIAEFNVAERRNVDILIMSADCADELRSRIDHSDDTKRAIRRTSLVLSPATSDALSKSSSSETRSLCAYRIGIGLYAPVNKARRPARVQLAKDTNLEVKKITTRLCSAGGNTLKSTDIRKYFETDFVKAEDKRLRELQSTETVIHGFDANDAKKAKTLGAKDGLVLYGFRKRKLLASEMRLGTAQFVVADESKLGGSSKAFGVLLKSMLKMDVVAIVSMKWSMSSMRFGVLAPQEEQYDENEGKQLIPGGMYLYKLPFKDDVYSLWRKELYSAQKKEKPLTDDDDAGDDEKETVETYKKIKLNNKAQSLPLARQFARKLMIRDYDKNTFINPDLHTFYNALEHAAGISIKRLSSPTFAINPDVEGMKSRAGDLLKEFVRVEAGDDFDAGCASTRFGTKTGKRAAEIAERRQTKLQELEEKQRVARLECNDEQFLELYRDPDRTLHELTVKQLKVYCQAHGLSQAGKKDNIVITIEDDIEKKLKSVKRRKLSHEEDDDE